MRNLGIAQVSAKLNTRTRSIHWVRNHLSLKLEDKNGNWTELHAAGILLGTCTQCKERVIALTDRGQMRCTHCGGAVEWSFTRPQLSFIPEEESSFRGWDRGKNPALERRRKANKMKIEELGLVGDALTVAKRLLVRFPEATFTSGRRTIEQQARAMASNCCENPRWIAETYTPSAPAQACQAWASQNPTLLANIDETAAAFCALLMNYDDDHLAHLSKHLGGEAFDVQPTTEAWGQECCEFLAHQASVMGGKFLEKEGGLVRWHWQAA